MASQDSICDIQTEQVQPTAPLAATLSAAEDNSLPRKPVSRFGPATSTAPVASATSTASPFIRERASERPVSTGRAAALGDLRRAASKKTSELSPSVPDREEDVTPVDGKDTTTEGTPVRYWTPKRTHTTETATGPASSAFSIRSVATAASRPEPTLHEIVRKVSTRSPLDGGCPAEPEYVDAFIKCLQLVCDENDARSDESYPIEKEEAISPDSFETSSTSSQTGNTDDALIEKVFPVSVARRYSPDFLHHLQDHLRLSRRSLAAALVYLDRAHKLAGPVLTVCNKNVNSLVLSALVVACRVLEQRGYSDEVVALAAGLPGAEDVRRSVAFLLDALAWDASLTMSETRPYELLLEKLGADIRPQQAELPPLRADTIRARIRTLRMYYPPSSLHL